MHDIERELIEATGYKARQKYANRQDYLKSILNAVAKLTDDDFDALTDDTATWVNAAVESHNSKNEEISDFDELAPEEEGFAEEELSDPDPEDEIDPEASEEELEDSVDPETGEVLEDDEMPHDEETEAEVEPEPEPKPVKPKPKAKRSGKLAPQIPSPERKKPKKPIPPKFHPMHREDEDATLDKWGCIEGSKNAQALKFFERGATAAEVKQKMGGTYYNILARCVAQGHKMEKEGHIIKITHKNELGKKSGPAAKPTSKKKAK
jgi:hypothetical protein